MPYATGLDHSGELCIQICQCALQDFAVARVPSGVELLQHVLAGQQQAVPLALACDLSGSEWWPGRVLSRGFGLLLLDRFALPSSCHPGIIPTRITAAVLFASKYWTGVLDDLAKEQYEQFAKLAWLAR